MPTVISLFSGGGGMDCGLEAAGFETRFATDVDRHSIITLRHMRLRQYLGYRGGLLNAQIVQRDINNLTAQEILAATKMEVGQPDLLAGGPPCQSFSVFGRRQGLNDPRGKLVYQYLRILRGIRPRVFLFENVPGLLTIENGEVFAHFLHEVQKPFEGYQYRVKKYVLEAAKFGVPQFRTRVVVIGVLQGVGLGSLDSVGPKETHSLSGLNGLIPYNTVEDALVDLPSIDEAALMGIRNHIGRVHGDNIIDRYRNLRFGERDPKTRINKLNPERPSYTIIVGSDKGGGKGHVHPYQPREVTPRESARMQSFPDWWGFSGTSRHPIRQVGNAVPPLLASAIGNYLREQVFSLPVIQHEDVMDRLGQNHLLEAETRKIYNQQQITDQVPLLQIV